MARKAPSGKSTDVYFSSRSSTEIRLLNASSESFARFFRASFSASSFAASARVLIFYDVVSWAPDDTRLRYVVF